MSDIEQRLADYRDLRDSSKTVLLADIEHARTAFSAKGLTSRYLGGVAEGARDVYEVAKVHTHDHRGIIAIVLGALALWFGREPLLDALAEELAEEVAEEVESQDTEPDDVTNDTVQPSETDPMPQEPPCGDTHDH